LQYFSNLPTLEYTISSISSTAKMKNIFFHLNIILDDNEFIDIYRIDGIKRLDTISFELYNKTDYWWILALLNKIDDIIFDLPISEEILYLIAKDRTKKIYGDDVNLNTNTEAMNYYISQVEILILENDNKRIIKVINPLYIGTVLSEVIKSI